MKEILSIKVGGNIMSHAEALQRLRNGLARRKPLNLRIANDAQKFTRKYLGGLNRHKTATKLGAKPTGHHAKAARGVEADADDTFAILRVPRATGLGRAFSDVVIRPGSGRKYLTIPADARTYGKRAGEFPTGTFTFAIIGGRHPVLMFTEGWTVAYFLRRLVTQKQDRTLLPSDGAYLQIATTVSLKYSYELMYGPDASPPSGGMRMPTA